MKTIQNIKGLTTDDLTRELSKGGSPIYLIRSGESVFQYGLCFMLLSLLLGWWALPWGPLYTVHAIFTNLNGGKDVTYETVELLNQEFMEDE